jgi:hypothetical protein
VSCDGADWVEIKNVGTVDVELGTVTVTDDTTDATHRAAFPDAPLVPGARAVVDVTEFGIKCDETVSLLRGSSVIDSTTIATASAGATWSRLPEPIAASSTFAESFPTRGAENAPFAVADLRINEVDCLGAERVELINTGASSVDVDGYVLAIDATPAGRYVLPAATIPPAGRLVVNEANATAATPGFDFNIACNGGSLSLSDDAGSVLDALVVTEVAEAFTWGRLPDGVGEFAANEETMDAANIAPAVLGAGVFEVGTVANITVDVDNNDRGDLADGNAVPCTFTFGNDAALACSVQSTTTNVFDLTFDDTARFRGLEQLTLDTSGRDPSFAADAVASALFRGLDVLAPRVGLASTTIAGDSAELALVLEVIDGRTLKRTFASTKHLYGTGDGPLDVVSDDVGDWTVLDGNDTDRSDLVIVADTIAPFIDATGFLLGAADRVRMGATIRFLAVDAWLGHTDGYTLARGDTLAHLDSNGQLRLLPGNLDNVLQGDEPTLDGGSAVVDACLADNDCLTELVAALDDVSAAVFDLELEALVSTIQATAGTALSDGAALDAAAASLRGRLASRAAEVDLDVAAALE